MKTVVASVGVDGFWSITIAESVTDKTVASPPVNAPVPLAICTFIPGRISSELPAIVASPVPVTELEVETNTVPTVLSGAPKSVHTVLPAVLILTFCPAVIDAAAIVTSSKVIVV